MSRTNNSLKNMKYAIVGQGLGLLISFVSRMAFVRILSAEYLGLNGLFTNILSILSLAELGVGAAIIYSMYKPLADKDMYKIKALMGLYKKAYVTIGIAIAFIGSALTPFLNYLIKDMPDLPYIKLIYLMFVANSSISYFYSYKRSLIIADQKRYVATFYRYGFYFLLNVIQIIVLLFTRSYIFYLGLQIINTFLENICVSRKTDQLYPFLKEKGSFELDKEEKKTIVQNVKAMVFHKIGSIVVVGTDNILISKFIGVIQVGLYSNYQLIINALNTVFGLVFQSVTASIGNLGATENSKKNKFIFECINLIGFWIYAFSSICLINLFNPFINLWLGAEYLFSMPIVLIIIISFYLSGMRKSVLTFRDALGLFWHDRYKAIFEAGINLVASIILAQYIGIAGIFIGTIISTLTTCFWIEPYILFKYGFEDSVKSYFKKYGFYTINMIIVGVLTWFISSIFSDYSILGFIGKLVVCIIVPNTLFLIIFWRTKEFQYLIVIVKPMIYKLFKRFKTREKCEEV